MQRRHAAGLSILLCRALARGKAALGLPGESMAAKNASKSVRLSCNDPLVFENWH
jgi:hypothetical protein